MPQEDSLRVRPSTLVFLPSPTAICTSVTARPCALTFGSALKFGGICNLRMDDTNPAKEDTEYVDAIKEDIHWLGFDWDDRFFYGSDYFEQTYQFAEDLIREGPGLCVRADSRAV